MNRNVAKPVRIRLEASSVCQLKCLSCPTTTRHIHPTVGSGLLKFDDFRQLVDGHRWIREIELSNYGEIFLNPDLLSIVEYAHRRKITLRADNGVNLNHAENDVLEGLVKYQFGSLTCSIDGASNETYKVYRVKGHFDRVIENIRQINCFKQSYRSPHPLLRWQFVAFEHNEHEIPDARRLAAELNMSLYVKLSWDEQFSPARRQGLLREETGAASRSEFYRLNGVDYMQEICHQLWDQPQINWDGKVLGCCRNFWGDFGGNAFRDGLSTALNRRSSITPGACCRGKRLNVPTYHALHAASTFA